MERMVRMAKFLSTPSARRATSRVSSKTCLPLYFYPRPPRGGRHSRMAIKMSDNIRFLSTPSARRATEVVRCKDCIYYHFYPRPPRGGRPEIERYLKWRYDFYPRPPRGGRPDGLVEHIMIPPFLSTPSARRATLGRSITNCRRSISIHALREEGDSPSLSGSYTAF